ncbi:MAG: SGNH/GDSL hydrolase family protein [Candidatus Delongbacteria bacterium]|nr:SGNH/GDSL hydrolase family protein [Candidatus Delongbacteria bacterium]
MENKEIKIKHPVLILLTITIVLFLFTDLLLGLILLKRDQLRIDHSYYHHDLKPNKTENAKWGDLEYTVKTNSLGFKDGEMRNIPLKSERDRILIIGDSFTEGLGYKYEDTFCGLLQAKINDRSEILNAGVTSYSPKLYYLKIKYLLEMGLEFEHLIVMLDISDIQDESVYENFQPRMNKSPLRKFDVILSNYSFSYHHLLRNIIKKAASIQKKESSKFADAETFLETSIEDRGRWTYDNKVFEDWGKIGLELASMNLLKLTDLCNERSIDLTLVVYPWPEQILERDSLSIQSKYWSEFCHMNKIDFLDLFPYFFNSENAEDVIGEYFIAGDDHWNENGHQLIAEKLYEKIIGSEIND